jgi:hypothetical protein
MYDPAGFRLGNFLPRSFGIVSWCVNETEVGTSKRLPMLAIADIPFDIRQNRCAKELCIIPHSGRQSKKTVDAGRRPNNGNEALSGLDLLGCSSWKSGPGWSPSRIMGVLITEP